MAKLLFDVCCLIVLLFIPETSCGVAEVIKSIANIDTYRTKCYEKIISLKNADEGWGYETPRVITSLQLGQSGCIKQILPSVKQMEVELLSELLNEDDDNPMRAGRLAMFVYGLVATCQSPRNFHQIDLLEKLNSIRIYNSFELGYVSLALCVAGDSVDQNKIDLMVSYLNNFTAEETYMRDYIAILAQAIECVVKFSPSTKLTYSLTKARDKLKSTQNIDGSFGNIDTTTVVAQALLNANDENWNASSVVYYFLNSQKSDGTIGNKATTVQIYPILYAKNYIDLLQIKCTASSQCHSTSVTTERTKTTKTKIDDKPIYITYSLWVGDDAKFKTELKLTVPSNVSFYEVMKIAAAKDSRYKFEAIEYSFGHYVQSIGGIKESLTEHMYWILSILKGNEELPTQSNTGVDTFIPKDGDHIVFWYKTVLY